MTDLRQETVDTYNKSAQQLANYFSGIGPRTDDISLSFDLAGNPDQARVVEIGCGDGRDAKEIVQRSDFYVGFDISEGLVDIARKQVPTANFVIADAIDYEFPDNLDIVFAFASLLHLDKDEFKLVVDHVAHALKQGGIFYISLKYRPNYEQDVKEDQYGRRQFYFYNESVVSELTDHAFETVHAHRKVHGNTEWLEVALRKKA